MRNLLLTLALLLPTLEGWGQSLLWERRYSWNNSSDILYDVVTLEDNTFLAAGTAGFTTGVALLGFTAWGDTLYSSAVPMSYPAVGAIKLCRLSSGGVFLAASISGATNLAKINPLNGAVIWMDSLPGTGPLNNPVSVSDLSEGPNSSILLAGRCTDPFGQAANAGYLACYDTLGTLQWDTIILEHPRNTFCHHVEMTQDGNILVSGTAGSRIFAAEYAYDGYEIRRATFYQNTSRTNFDYNPTVSVRQVPGNRYLVSGRILTNPGSYYLGLHQGWAGGIIWGGEQIDRLSQVPQVNNDASITYYEAIANSRSIVRIRADSTTIWRTQMVLSSGQLSIVPSIYASLPDSSGVIIGYSRYSIPAGTDWYAARITNMGIPYRPWQPATATQAKATQSAPRPYPNPCTSTLHFAGLAAPARLELYGTDGRLHLSQALAPGQAVDVSALVAGVYGYRLTAQGKVWRGRVVKR